MIMKKLVFTIFCFIVSVQYSIGQSFSGSNYISTAVPFLTISPDSRSAGMGDVGVATSADINSIHWNIAKLAFIKDIGGISFSYTPWLRELTKDMYLGYLSTYYKISNNQVLSSSFRYFNLGNVDIVNTSGERLKTANPNEFALDFGYSRTLGKSFSMGVVFRYICSDIIDGKIGNSLAADIGCYYFKNLSDSKLAFGLNISNIGSRISYAEKNYYIPTNLRIGTSYTTILSSSFELSISFDINKLLVSRGETTRYEEKLGVFLIGNESNDDILTSMISSFSDYSAITYSFGVESVLMRNIFLRLGYFYENADSGNRNYVTTGIGIKYKKMNFDFAYLIATESNNPLKNTVRLSLSYSFTRL